MKWENILIGALLIIGVIVLFGVVMTIPLWLLWNWLFPAIFGLPKITIWQALGLNLLAIILFKNTTTSYSSK